MCFVASFVKYGWKENSIDLFKLLLRTSAAENMPAWAGHRAFH